MLSASPVPSPSCNSVINYPGSRRRGRGHCIYSVATATPAPIYMVCVTIKRPLFKWPLRLNIATVSLVGRRGGGLCGDRALLGKIPRPRERPQKGLVDKSLSLQCDAMA
jgi:hypothetical protein